MKDRMRPYLAIFRQKLMSGLQYRAGFWGTTTTHVVWVYMRVVLVSIFYRYGSGQAGAHIPIPGSEVIAALIDQAAFPACCQEPVIVFSADLSRVAGELARRESQHAGEPPLLQEGKDLRHQQRIRLQKQQLLRGQSVGELVHLRLALIPLKRQPVPLQLQRLGLQQDLLPLGSGRPGPELKKYQSKQHQCRHQQDQRRVPPAFSSHCLRSLYISLGTLPFYPRILYQNPK